MLRDFPKLIDTMGISLLIIFILVLRLTIKALEMLTIICDDVKRIK
jgi:hypothetical protein